MSYPTITIEGNILSPEVLERLETDDVRGQAPKDFGLKAGQRVKDEIARAWGEALLQWKVFQSKKERLDDRATGTTETRRFWMEPFLDTLGYRLTPQQGAEVINGETYAISHRDEEVDRFPVLIMGFGDSLDEQLAGRLRLSPHGLVQEYLNLTEHLYALVTNGHRLRLLRDSSRLTRLTYLEFDLEAMMEEEAYADFAVLYRLLHRSRMPQAQDAAAEAIIEQYHQDALDAGARIRDRLSKAVERALRGLGNGLLQHPDNVELRERIARGDVAAEALFAQLLRVVYRLLFLFVVEERDLVYPKHGDDAVEAERAMRERWKGIYDRYYAASRIRNLVESRHLVDSSAKDLWTGLFSTFRLFERGDVGGRLGIAPLAGELFGSAALNDLIGTRLANGVLLDALSRLTRFKDDRDVWQRVNYAALNVEEFGSVYEGLLELDPFVEQGLSPQHGVGWAFTFREGDARRNTGSHYTHDELVRPLVEHALDPLIEERVKAAQKARDPEAVERALLSLRVADVACGSGHFLLAAARRIGYALAQHRTGEEQPNPNALREATRDAIAHCVYGVDKNPMAVELCKVALWLEAHNPGKPLTFLDHRVKCGDAIVGLARPEDLFRGVPTEAFAPLPGDDKKVTRTLRDRNAEERKRREAKGGVQLGLDDDPATQTALDTIQGRAAHVDAMPDDTVERRQKKAEAALRVLGEEGHRLMQEAHAQLAPFFVRKTQGTRELVFTDGTYRHLRAQSGRPYGTAVAKAEAVGEERKLFHWFLAFPDVFLRENGGFDCILGNPPYLGGQKLSGTFGKDFLEYVRWEYAPAGAIDLVGYFFRRIHGLLREGGATGLIATNTVAQGDTREGGLKVVLDEGGTINFAIRSMKWPGRAGVEVSLLTIQRGDWKGPVVLDGQEVEQVNSHLSDEEPLPDPFELEANADLAFQGSIVLGMGFVLEPEQAQALIAEDPKNRDVLFPYMNGQDLNRRPDQTPSRWVINFFDWPLDAEQDRENKKPQGRPYASDYPDCLAIVERDVKPERQRMKKDGSFKLRKPLPQRWWQYGEKRPKLYSVIEPMKRVIALARAATKYPGFSMVPADQVFADVVVVLALDSFGDLAILSSNVHEAWAWKRGSTMKRDLRYTHNTIVPTFPFPERNAQLQALGERLNVLRRSVMERLDLGLTKVLNLFHTRKLTAKKIAKAAKCEEAVAEAVLPDLEALRALQADIDEAVKAAYGWDGLDLDHGFHEIEYLPENDRVRFTISPQARREVLRRLLFLNHERHAVEQAAKEDAKKAKKQRATTEPVREAGKSQPRLRLDVGEGPLFGGAQDRPPVEAEKEAKRPTDRRPATAHGPSESGADRKAPDREANPQFRRAALAAEVVERLRGTRGFGRMKLQKALYLCEKHAALQIKSDYLKEKHGPFDPGMMGNVEQILRQNKWAERVQRENGRGFDYAPMEKAGGHREYYERYWGDADDAISEVLGRLAGMSGRDSEIVATLYGVWLECLEKGEEPTTRALVGGALRWHPAKRQIHARDWEWWAEWMRQAGFHPTA